MVSTQVPVVCVCVWCVVCLVLCVVYGGAVGRVWGRRGRDIDNGDWVMGPMCCGVYHLGCPKYTAKPMGRIVVKLSLARSSLGVHHITCGGCVVCGVSCVVCVVWVGRWEGWEEERVHRQWWVGVGPYVLWCVLPWLPEIHIETCGPNSREIVAGAFVAWCPPKYL